MTNEAVGSVIGVPGGGGNKPPNDSNCGGKYNLTENPTGKNFGDPLCSFDKDTQLPQMLQQLDPANADLWYTIARCESTFNPNAYNPAAVNPAGAWGLIQMAPAGKGNGEYDAGDVPWQQQISNGINYNNKVIGGNFAYWQGRFGCNY